jgi:pyridoxamine 5'-phosphate oxidase
METLPRPAPTDPLPLAAQWLAEAEARVEKNPWAMALATTAASGAPSVRYVLLKALSADEGFIVFYTNYGSRKAAELDGSGRAAGALYWPDAGRQLRFEGTVERSPAAESDAYFATRPRLSQLNAWASEQSRPIAAPDDMDARLAEREAAFAGEENLPRPDGWGGYRLMLDAVEFWLEGADRFHERLRYGRDADSGWTSAWLQP